MEARDGQTKTFRFFSRLNLTELTGLRASTLTQLLDLVRIVPGSCIYHHTHRFLQQHEYLSPEPPNDFAYWVREVLGDERLGEKLASIDTIKFKTIRSLREEIAGHIERHLKDDPFSRLRFSLENQEFYFMKSISFIFPTRYSASSLGEFLEVMRKITIDSIYFHMFEARLRLEKGTNDFSLWLETSLGEKDLAYQLAQLDPYTYTLEDLRKKIIALAETRKE